MTDTSVVAFTLRDITNLDAHPKHFHSTTWHFHDGNHLTQDWQIVDHRKEVEVMRLVFARRK